MRTWFNHEEVAWTRESLLLALVGLRLLLQKKSSIGHVAIRLKSLRLTLLSHPAMSSTQFSKNLVYVVAALQEEAEIQFIESILEKYDVSIIAMPNSDGVTWFKQKYPKALVYSWQQAQDIDFHRKRAPYIGSYELCQIIDLNAVINNGRGSSVVRSIISELERGNYDGAAQVATIDSDKVRQYPEMFDLLHSLGYQVN
jgi:hypothetical protein